MKATQWNVAMATALTALVVLSIPFFAYADFADGGFSGFTDGGFSGFDDGGFSGFTDGGFSGFANGGTSGTADGAIGSGDTSSDSFDDNFDPIDTIPGNPGGPDQITPGTGGNFPPVGCTVNCNPVVPTPTHHVAGPDSMSIFINQIVLHDAFQQLPGNYVPMYVTFENDGTKKLESTKVIITIPDIAVHASVGPFDLTVGDQLSKLLILELPADVAPGTYPVRFQIYNENRERIVHREIEIVDSA